MRKWRHLEHMNRMNNRFSRIIPWSDALICMHALFRVDGIWNLHISFEGYEISSGSIFRAKIWLVKMQFDVNIQVVKVYVGHSNVKTNIVLLHVKWAHWRVLADGEDY